MKKRVLLIACIAFPIGVAGIWGAPNIQALFTSRKPANNAATASLYITGTQAIPTIALPSPATKCDPQDIPGVASDPAGGEGAPAIKPHLCSIPTFTEQDARQYMRTVSHFSGLRVQQISPHYTITRVLFVTNQVANDLLNADTGVVSATLIVCYVEVYGDFTVVSPFAAKGSKPVPLHHGQMVFDGVTGNMLVMGVVA
jgi:hypothetical protein